VGGGRTFFFERCRLFISRKSREPFWALRVRGPSLIEKGLEARSGSPNLGKAGRRDRKRKISPLRDQLGMKNRFGPRKRWRWVKSIVPPPEPVNKKH